MVLKNHLVMNYYDIYLEDVWLELYFVVYCNTYHVLIKLCEQIFLASYYH